jgi:protein phosphatase
MPRIAAFGKTDVGLRRANNEDALVLVPEALVFAVADGMGGAASGEVASAIFVDTVRDVAAEGVPATVEGVVEAVRNTFLRANHAIFTTASENPEHAGMGCTAEMLAFVDDLFVLGHVGDSRTYLFRDGRLRRITKDHSLVQDQLDRKLITEEQARTHAMRNVIIRAVGIEEPIAIDILRGQVFPGDLFLLCSDGLSDMAEDAAIEERLAGREPVSEMVDRLIDLAKAGGGRDNVTVLLCEVVAVS